MEYKNTQMLSKLIFIFYALFSFIFFTIGQNFIPPLFNQDGKTIRIAMLGGIPGSYGAAADFYKLIGFGYNSSDLSVELFSWIVYLISLYLIFKICNGDIISGKAILLLTVYTVSFGFYYATFSKDIILLIFTFIIVSIYLKKGCYFHIPIILFIYGAIYRQYWIIIAVMFFAISMFNLKKIKISFVFYMTIVIIYLYEFFIGTYITDTRVGVNLGRIANTTINNLLPNNSYITDLINYVYVLASMVLPIQGIGSFNGIIYYLWIWLLTIIFLINKRKLNIKFTYLFLIYLNIQACFEPDFGSAIRHMMPLILIVFISIYRGDDNELHSKGEK